MCRSTDRQMKSQISNFQHSSPRTKNQGRTFSYAYAAAAAAVTAPLGAPGNERVECDGGLHVRWEISSRADDGRAKTVTLYPGCKALGGGAYDCARGCPYKAAADATRRDIRDYARVTDGETRSRILGAPPPGASAGSTGSHRRPRAHQNPTRSAALKARVHPARGAL